MTNGKKLIENVEKTVKSLLSVTSFVTSHLKRYKIKGLITMRKQEKSRSRERQKHQTIGP